MQIIIPMSGYGERFRRAGYSFPKPLINVGGKPIIAHVIEMFPENYPGEQEFIFICNQEHLDDPDYNMEQTIHKYCPAGKVIGIAPHKLGPIYAVLQAEKWIKPESKVVVNYCDFSCYWDWHHFQRMVAEIDCAGAIPAYKGFHPHTLGTTNYAYLRERNNSLLDIQEKQPFTDNRMQEYASSGTYYFASGKLMLDAFKRTIAEKRNVNGEYYVSLAYKTLLEEKKPIAVYPLEYFMQWGTPEDLVEYQGWYDIFIRYLDPRKEPAAAGALIIPMAGLGKRFSDAGYKITKPLLTVTGKPMVIQAADSYPPSKQQSFVLRSDMPGYKEITETLKENYPESVIKTIDSVTEGQAISALIGLDALEQAGAIEQPVTFAACDSAVQYNCEKYLELINNKDVDVIVWAARGHANALRNPKMFGWIHACEGGLIKNISVKTPLDNPATDPIVIGTFTFARATDFRNSVDSLIKRDGRINGEFYIDSCINDAINRGLKCYIFEVDGYISWGTPNDLKTFEYWQSCFNQWHGHPYTLAEDITA